MDGALPSRHRQGCPMWGRGTPPLCPASSATTQTRIGQLHGSRNVHLEIYPWRKHWFKTASYPTAAMDIDDILREVDPTFHSIPQEKRDLQELTRAWIAERSAPELLPYACQPSLFQFPRDSLTDSTRLHPAGPPTASSSASRPASSPRSKKSRSSRATWTPRPTSP
jgi:hypothetical protein